MQRKLGMKTKKARPYTLWLQASTHDALDRLSGHLHTSKREVIERLIHWLEKERSAGRLKGIDFVLGEGKE